MQCLEDKLQIVDHTIYFIQTEQSLSSVWISYQASLVPVEETVHVKMPTIVMNLLIIKQAHVNKLTHCGNAICLYFKIK